MSLPDKNIRILSVDDFSTMRRIVKNILKQLGYTNVDEAENGAAALEALRDKPYDLVISDWNMPVKSGIELLKEVRSDPNLKEVPFLMVTAEAEKDNVVEAMDAGVSNYLLKPFTAKTLEEKMSGIFPD
ncbi:MAG TPA: response regulator [Myxococcales bacterium LLY-WYZ-16_1]|jgi:two-component system chemotaxis response regulator CheY|nr:response regulator [Myxococcales bacterium LLY-WYZ-16_1]